MEYHYVYRITNHVIKKHYYGVRSSMVHPSDDLGKVYFSSSVDLDFIQDQKNNPQNYTYKIVSVFENREEAALLEIKLHDKFNVASNDSFYNRSKSTSTGFSVKNTTQTKEHILKRSATMKGKKQSKEHVEKRRNKLIGLVQSEEAKKKRSKSMKGKNTFKRTKETCMKMSNAKKGQKLSEEHKNKLSENNSKYWLGKERSEATKLKISKKQKGIPRGKMQLVKCPHCSKVGGKGLMTRYHFDNCKNNSSF